MFEQDYIMRLIREMVRTLVKLVFKVDIENPEQVDFDNADMEEEYYNLIAMINSGMVNEAENMLLDQLDLTDKKAFLDLKDKFEFTKQLGIRKHLRCLLCFIPI